MNVAIIYESITGNTAMLAMAIKEHLGDKVIYFGEPKAGIDADIYFVGSCTLKGMCTEKIETFLKSLEHKTILYFGTAGFGGSIKYYDSLFQRVNLIISKTNTVIDYFYCQGKMPSTVLERYTIMLKDAPDNKNIMASVQNFKQALNHPNHQDISEVKQWVEKNINRR